MSFNRHFCPTGWSEVTQAEGRTVVGRNPGRTLRGTVGVKMSDREIRQHNHRVDPVSEFTAFSGAHAHAFVSYQNGPFTSGGGQGMIEWTTGWTLRAWASNR